MKLIKLEILNLASLDNKSGEVINFEEGALGATSIFSIVGPTGSGKSTLLDAICLALYNRAPRYPRKKNERNQGIEIYGEPEETEKNRLAPTDGRNILTRGKKNGYSKLTFLANNGNVYRAEWHVRFLLKNYESASTSLYILCQNNGKYVEKECSWDELPQIIGLEYDQFLRTVLIAQGSFANFLNAKENERYELLEKLIGCEELYSNIACKIKGKRDAAQERYNIINAQVDSFKQYVLNETDLRALIQNIDSLEKTEKLLNDQLMALDKALNWYETENKLLEEIKSKTENEATAKEALNVIKEDIYKLQLHDAISPAVTILREVRRLGDEIISGDEATDRVQVEISQQLGQINTNQNQLTTLENEAKAAQDAIDIAKPHIRRARELSTHISLAKDILKDKKSALDKAKKNQKNAQQELNINIDSIKKEEEQKFNDETKLTKVKQTIDKGKKRLLEAENEATKVLLTEQAKIEGISAETLRTDYDKASKNLIDITSALDILSRIDALKEELKNHTEDMKVLQSENDDFKAVLKTLNIANLQQEVNTLQDAYTLITSEDWNRHRSKLKEGEPCPLCGSNHHPFSHDASTVEATTSELYALLQEKKFALQEQQKKEKNIMGKLNKNEGKFSSIKSTVDKEKEELRKEESKWSVIVSIHGNWTMDKSALESLKSDLDKTKNECEKAWSVYNETQKSIKHLTKQKEQATKNKNDYDKNSDAEVKRAEDQIIKTNTSLENHKAQTRILEQQLKERTCDLESAAKAYEEANQNLTDLLRQFNEELGGKHPDILELQLNQKKKDKDKEVTDKKKEITEQQTELSRKQGALTIQIEKKNKAQESKLSKIHELNLWIDDFNNRSTFSIDESVVAKILEANDDWELIRRNKSNKETVLTSAKTLREKAEKDMAQHLKLKPDKNVEELKSEKENLAHKSKKQELDDANLKLKQHNDAINKMGDKVEELQQATADNEDWKAINDSIGGDGKTLRKIAQCYTLRFLVEHANAEIRKFNNRYELQQVKNSLGIRVIDHDRADDVRDTTSLSGGETFIVSLGLALGLSSLSSRNISFDNLFIDEGFGTLDPDTLATVIDALAMLQTSQGKKVGVISHTDTMSERITTQIRIIKNGNSGSSHIEIYP